MKKLIAIVALFAMSGVMRASEKTVETWSEKVKKAKLEHYQDLLKRFNTSCKVPWFGAWTVRDKVWSCKNLAEALEWADDDLKAYDLQQGLHDDRACKYWKRVCE